MIDKINTLFATVAEEIHVALTKRYPELTFTVSELASLLTRPPKREMGNFAFPCFIISKAVKKAPQQVAQELVPLLTSPSILKSVAMGPYLNIYISKKLLKKAVLDEIRDGSFFNKRLVSDVEKIMIEYSQPNTHKELHVGHMRNICLGNAVIRMLRYAGHNVISATYPGDVGTHVAKCLWYLKNHNVEPIPTHNPGAFLGKIYTLATLKLEEFAETEAEETSKREIGNILKQLEEKEGEYYNEWLKTREWSINLFQAAYDWAGITFDKWYFESDVDSSSLAYVKNLYDQGKLTLSEGAIGMDLSDLNLGFCMLIKSDGNGLYATKDIALAFQKFEDYQLDRNIYVVDKRQAYHFKQVFGTLKKLGFKKAANCFHLEYDFVELPSGAMSSRKGNIIPLMDLVTGMEETIKNEYLNRYATEWSQEEINHTAKIVAGGAIKYGMLKMDNNRKIVFDLAEWLKLDGETGPYLQYVYARINSLCKKQNYDATKEINPELLTHIREEDLLLHLSTFNNVVADAAKEYKTSAICSYLYDLAKYYNSFYAECSISKAENDEIAYARLELSHAVKTIMKEGLALLGIEAPERM